MKNDEKQTLSFTSGMDTTIPYLITRTQKNTKTFPLHVHGYWEILYYTKGSGFLRLENGISIPFDVGYLICVPPGTAHGSSSESVFEDYCIQDPLFPEERFDAYRRDSGNGGCVVYSGSETAKMEYFFKLMLHTYHTGGKNAFSLIRHLLLCVYDLIPEIQPDGPTAEAVGELKNILADKFTDPDFSVGDAIGILSYSPNYLRSVFRQQVGMTPARYLLLLRLNNAERLLSGSIGDFSVAEAARNSGFRDPLYFSKAFHKQFGITPTERKEQNLSEINRKDERK